VAINQEQAIKLILKANGITGPLVPLAIKVLREQFESGEAFGSDVVGPFTAGFNPAGEIAATLGREKKRRTKKQRANDKKKSEAWALANAKGRRKNGEFYAGWDQRRIAEYANKVLKKM
jgi:hypothetical protein